MVINISPISTKRTVFDMKKHCCMVIQYNTNDPGTEYLEIYLVEVIELRDQSLTYAMIGNTINLIYQVGNIF